MSSQVSALKRIITKEDHNKYSVILLRNNTTNCATNQLVIGRDNDCNYRITSIEISRKHACIKFDDNNWHITDLQSTNGLFINGIQLKPYTPYCLINGDRISFGPQTHSEFVYQFVTDYQNSLDVTRLNLSSSLPLLPIRIHTSSSGDSSSSASSTETISPPLPSNTVRFNIEPNVSGTISVTAMPTRSGANYHNNSGAANNNNSNNISSKRERKVKQETVNNRALVNDHEYSRSALFIPSSGSSSKRSAKNKSKDKLKELEKKRYEKEMEKLRKEKMALEQKKDSERQRIKRKEENLKRWKAELDEKEKETKKKEEEIEKMKKQLKNEKKLLEERNKRLERERKEDKESKSSNSNKKYASKRKVCDTSLIESKTGANNKRLCNDIIDNNQEQQLEEIFDSELTCTICHELFVHAVNLNCSHTFCFACIEQWKHANNVKKECPICRVEIKNQNRQLVLDNLIERIVNKMKPEQKEHREKLVEERKKKLVKSQQQHVSRRLSSNRVVTCVRCYAKHELRLAVDKAVRCGVVSSYPLSSLHVILREATNASTETDSDSNSDVSSNDEVSVIGIGFAGGYDFQSLDSADSDVSQSSTYDSSDDDSDSDSIAHQSNTSNREYSDDSSVVSLGDDDDDDNDNDADEDDGDDEDDAQSYVSLSSIAETSDISDSSEESTNESDAESIFHIYDSTDVASVNSIFTSV